MTRTDVCGMMMSTGKQAQLRQDRQWECPNPVVDILTIDRTRKVYCCKDPHMREIEELKAWCGHEITRRPLKK